MRAGDRHTRRDVSRSRPRLEPLLRVRESGELERWGETDRTLPEGAFTTLATIASGQGCPPQAGRIRRVLGEWPRLRTWPAGRDVHVGRGRMGIRLRDQERRHGRALGCLNAPATRLRSAAGDASLTRSELGGCGLDSRSHLADLEPLGRWRGPGSATVISDRLGSTCSTASLHARRSWPRRRRSWASGRSLVPSVLTPIVALTSSPLQTSNSTNSTFGGCGSAVGTHQGGVAQRPLLDLAYSSGAAQTDRRHRSADPTVNSPHCRAQGSREDPTESPRDHQRLVRTSLDPYVGRCAPGRHGRAAGAPPGAGEIPAELGYVSVLSNRNRSSNCVTQSSSADSPSPPPRESAFR